MSDEPNTTALAAPSGMAELATMSDEQIAQREAAIKRAAEAKKRLVTAALTLAYPKDFQDFDGTPYLTGSGAMRLCGVGLKLSAPIVSHEKVGNHHFVEALVEAEWPACGQRATGLGTCDTADRLWNNDAERSQINKLREKFGGDEALANRALRGWVTKKAIENATSRAVSDCMGIKGLKWAELALAGFTPEKAGVQVKYKAKKQPKKSTGTMETVDVAAMLALAVGSKVSLRATIAEPAKIGGKSTRFFVASPEGVQAVFCRGTDPAEGWVVPGAEAFFAEVEVNEYQGKTNYWASHPQEVTEGGGGDD